MYAIRSYYALWDQPIDEPCPKCGYPVIVEKVTKRYGTYRNRITSYNVCYTKLLRSFWETLP